MQRKIAFIRTSVGFRYCRRALPDLAETRQRSPACRPSSRRRDAAARCRCRFCIAMTGRLRAGAIVDALPLDQYSGHERPEQRANNRCHADASDSAHEQSRHRKSTARHAADR
ncbi:hypothetical protein AYI69_g11346 [Smittium culicis]|uniref:Uncharacterized protein n=1 Tax=Smittium culicis TaxID=133412 RepID=A0A1R1WZC9_9FUNG|nr:hypothetical protein AYI69_g11346 [Smittium culicis]